MVVLLLSHPLDGHIEPVARLLKERGSDVVSVDLADVPLHLSFSSELSSSGWGGQLHYQDQVIDLAQIQAVWWRRPTSPVPPASYTLAEGAFWIRENERGFTSMLLPPPGQSRPFWCSSPHAIRQAARKPLQLATAQALGLTVPRTLLTTDPQAARDFYHACDGQVVCKAIARGVLEHEGEYLPGEKRFLYTSALAPEHLEQMESVRVMTHYFQERIKKVVDVRVVIIGEQVFAFEIRSPDDGPVHLDWRRDYSQLSYAVHTLPEEIAQKLLHLVRAFHLQFSSVDLLLDEAGNYIYIEQNPNGQFLWPALATGLPLAEAMANLLLYPEEFAL